MGFHVVQLLLFVGRFFTSLNPWITRFGAWLVRHPSVGVDDGHRIFNVDCRVSHYTFFSFLPLFLHVIHSTLNILQSGLCLTLIPYHAFESFADGWTASLWIQTAFDRTSL